MKCVLHIGTEKTATTLLQRWLYENEANLSKHRIALTRSAGFPNNRKLVVCFQDAIDDFVREKNLQSPDRKAEFIENFAAKFSEEIALKARAHDTVIITSEQFHSRLNTIGYIRALKKFLDRFFSDIEVICYFREQSKLRTSLYSTVLRGGRSVSIEQFQKTVKTDDHYYNYYAFFRKWEKVFGKENLTPRIFEKRYLVEGDIRLDFLQSAIPQVGKSEITLETKTANRSLSAFQAELVRTVNAARPKNVGRFPDPTTRRITQIVEGHKFHDSEQAIVDPRQIDLYNTFNRSNLKFFKRYFGEKRNYFSAPDDVSLGQTHTLSQSEGDVKGLMRKIANVDNLIFVARHEIDFIRDLAIKLSDRDLISKDEAVNMLKIAHRARPDCEIVTVKIEEISKED